MLEGSLVASIWLRRECLVVQQTNSTIDMNTEGCGLINSRGLLHSWSLQWILRDRHVLDFVTHLFVSGCNKQSATRTREIADLRDATGNTEAGCVIC